MISACLERPSIVFGPSDRHAPSHAMSRLLAAAAFILLCVWTRSSPDALARALAFEGFDLGDVGL